MMTSYVEMLRFYGFKTMKAFMKKYGLYNLEDAKRMLLAMYEEDNAPERR